MRPLIGITCNVMAGDSKRPIYRGMDLHFVEASLSHSVVRVGGSPALIGVHSPEDDLEELVEDYDGLILSSGLDINASFYGHRPRQTRQHWAETEERDMFELALTRIFRESRRPVLGICRGVQIMNVAFGGSLLEVSDEEVIHRHNEFYEQNRHQVLLVKDCHLKRLINCSPLHVVSVHHQAIDRLGSGLRIAARAADGVIEAIEGTKDEFFIGVQWHPEWMPGEQAGEGLLRTLVGHAQQRRLRRPQRT